MEIAGKFDWDDIRYFLAVARHGSTIAAARELGVSQTTVARRLDGFERQLEVELFERAAGGYRLTDAGARAVPAAEAVEARMQQLASSFAQPTAEAGAPLRITTMELFARYVLLPAIDEVRGADADLSVELIIGDSLLDIAGGQVDLAFRGGPPPKDPDLVVRKIPVSDLWAFVAHPDYVRAHGLPRSLAELRDHRVVVAARADDFPAFAWALDLGVGVTEDPSVTTFPHQLALVMTGECVTLLPAPVGRLQPGLVTAFVPEERFPMEMWAVYHARTKTHAGLRPVMEAVTRQAERLRRITFDDPPLAVS
jgi:molybdate transport repressor ModE-like protein